MKLTPTITLLLLTGPTYTLAKASVRGRNLEEGLHGASHGRNLRVLDEECTAAVGIVDYEDNSEEIFLACELPNGKAYKVPTVGPDWIKNKMKNGELKSGSTVLDMPGALIDEANGKLVVSSPPGLVNKKDFNRNLRELARLGQKSVLVVRVLAADGSTTIPESGLSESVFTDPVCLASQYDKCSQGKFKFVQANSRAKVAGAPSLSTDISSGVTTVTVSTSTTQGDMTMNNAIASALNAQFGVSSPTVLADHVMYCLPPNTMSGIAYAYVNSWNSVYSDVWCTYVSGQMHEIGHNIGLAHSNENGQSYADQSGMMGYSYGQDDGPIMCFNGAKLWQLGWFTDADDALELNEGDLPVTLNLEGFVTANNAAVDGKVKVVKINTATPDSDLFMVFNWKAHHNSGTVEGGNQVTIVQQGAEGLSYSESSMLAKLSATGMYTSNDFFGTGKYVTVTVDAISTTDGVATVTVSGQPIVTPEPTTQAPTPPPTPECVQDGDCNDGDYCNGEETCSPDGVCVAGNGDPCVTETAFCGGPLQCDSALGTCVEVGDGGDGICNLDAGESCSLCAGDCMETVTEGGSQCGNGVCEDGENCNSCPGDCPGVTGGKPSARYCCVGGPGGCTDSRCTTGGKQCITSPSNPRTFETCCGDDLCEGNEAVTCPSDCTGTPEPTTQKPTTLQPTTPEPTTAPPTTQPPTTPGPTTQPPTTLPPGGFCGDGTCNGAEDCLSCPNDCDGNLTGSKSSRWCCMGPSATNVAFGVTC